MNSAAPEPASRDLLCDLLASIPVLASLLKKSAAITIPADSARVPKGGRKVLLALWDGPMTVPGIARACATSRQNIQVLVNSMKRKGPLVELITNPAHKRSSLVALTAAGRAIAETLVGEEQQRAKNWETEFSSSDLAAARKVLRRLEALLEPRKVGTERLAP